MALLTNPRDRLAAEKVITGHFMLPLSITTKTNEMD